MMFRYTQHHNKEQRTEGKVCLSGFLSPMTLALSLNSEGVA
ncbi:hypothetical protein BH10PAT3_BH10PAT3_3700 [soil metagenome]